LTGFSPKQDWVLWREAPIVESCFEMNTWKIFGVITLLATPVQAETTVDIAQENYIQFLSRDDLSEEQNRILAECMVERLSVAGQVNLANATSERAAALSFLADGQGTFHGSCMVKAIMATR
jgi:hypothetical protein